jgi:hypothetical protein
MLVITRGYRNNQSYQSWWNSPNLRSPNRVIHHSRDGTYSIAAIARSQQLIDAVIRSFTMAGWPCLWVIYCSYVIAAWLWWVAVFRSTNPSPYDINSEIGAPTLGPHPPDSTNLEGSSTSKDRCWNFALSRHLGFGFSVTVEKKVLGWSFLGVWAARKKILRYPDEYWTWPKQNWNYWYYILDISLIYPGII